MSLRQLLIFLLLIILLAGIVSGVYLISQKTNFFSQATPSAVPQELKITNVTDNSFSVSWLTPQKASVGFVTYGTVSSLDKAAFDDRDSAGQEKMFTHHVTVKNLEPDKIYYFKIDSEGKTYDNNGSPYQARTAPTTDKSVPDTKPAYGKIIASSSEPPKEGLVYLSFDKGAPLSTYLRGSGDWLVNLSSARKPDLSTYVDFEEDDQITVTVKAGSEGSASGKLSVQGASPAPTITLGQEGDFSSSSLTPSETSTDSAEGNFSFGNLNPAAGGTTSSAETAKEVSAPTIQFPTEGQKFTQDRPTFSGTGKKGETITIEIESNQKITAQVTVGDDGTWSYTPSESLDPGNHQVTVIQNGQSDSRGFSVEVLSLGSPSPDEGGDAVVLPDSGETNPTLGLFLVSLGILLFSWLTSRLVSKKFSRS
jgi:hypothetical protein